MNNNETPHIPRASLEKDEVSEVLQHFVNRGNSFEVMMEDLVLVRVDSSLKLIDLKIQDVALKSEMKKRLEIAIVDAVNAAFQRAALAAQQSLKDFDKQKK